uniref:FERM domain-containing protein 6-like isoform X2 n=1 Tax=Myxine glutinosa TaxID=7769 RepID=UPI00358E7EB8
MLHIFSSVEDGVQKLLCEYPWANVGKLSMQREELVICLEGRPSAGRLVLTLLGTHNAAHLLHQVERSRRWYSQVVPLLKQLQTQEESEDKPSYREFYVSKDSKTTAEQTSGGQRNGVRGDCPRGVMESSERAKRPPAHQIDTAAECPGFTSTTFQGDHGRMVMPQSHNGTLQESIPGMIEISLDDSPIREDVKNVSFAAPAL